MSEQLIEIRKQIGDYSKLKYPTKQGFLFKKSRYLKEWRSRFFVIEGEILYYFDVEKISNKPIGTPLGIFNLLKCSFTLISNEKRSPLVFRIQEESGANKDYKNCLISSETQEEFDQWFQLLPQIGQTINRKNQLVIKLQALSRKKLQQLKYKELKEAALIIQRFYHLHEGERKLARFIYNVVKVQSYARCFIDRMRFKKIKEEIMVIQSHFQVVKAKNRLEKEFMRRRIAQELLSTEKSYVYNLKLIIDIFIRPLINFNSIEQRVLSISEISGVFGNWERLYKINSDLLLLIQNKLDSWSIEQTIGDLFIESTDSLFEYTPYVTNYDHSRKLLDRLTASNTNFRNFLDAAQRDKRSKYLDISSFLIQPVQRLPRYELLLRDLLKSTSTLHNDHKYLTKGIVKIKEITMYVNDQQKERENLSQVIQIQKELIMDNIKLSFSSATRLIREGDIKVSKKKNWNYMYLFNSQLVIIQKKDDKKLVKEVIQLEQLGIRDDNNNNTITNDSTSDLLNTSTNNLLSSPDLSSSGGASSMANTSSQALPIGTIGNKFKLIISSKTEISLYFDTPEDKNNWFADIAITLNRLETQKKNFEKSINLSNN
ncbi:hypothetical protein RB653_003573 [Dictyostelium firmibasis]|uniref:Uncharacterized protein n=1 Tax=Dictyostelium firmibasis TaxID=79012 RepID=A0AAN7YZ84_9MYCE